MWNSFLAKKAKKPTIKPHLEVTSNEFNQASLATNDPQGLPKTSRNPTSDSKHQQKWWFCKKLTFGADEICVSPKRNEVSGGLDLPPSCPMKPKIDLLYLPDPSTKSESTSYHENQR